MCVVNPSNKNRNTIKDDDHKAKGIIDESKPFTKILILELME